MSNDVTTKNKALASKYLTFYLAGEEYGVEILKVHEIIGLMPITRVPRTPSYVRGVINLRGKVIPVTDLRAKFGMPTEDERATCIIVVQIAGTSIGIVVDRVSEVAAISPDDIEPPPSFGSEVPTDYLIGIGKAQDRVRLLLDIEKVLTSSEIIDLQALQAA